MKKSKFYRPKPLKERVANFAQSLLFWKGREKGMIYTRDIAWDDVRAVFFPKNFYEKYHYLGSVPYKEGGDIFKAMEPLVIFMDYKARPWWCPRCVLRFLHLFGDDNSIVRVRNRTLSSIKNSITKGIMIWDYKTKWHWYDLRISVAGTDQMQDLANSIEHDFYSKGRIEDLANQIKDVDPNTKYGKGYTISMLEKELERLVGEKP